MRLKEMQKQLTRLTVVLLMALEATSQALPGCPHSLPGCPCSCGNVSPIPYPFGIGNSKLTGKNCFLEEALNLTCTNSTLYRGKGNVQILNISLAGKMDVLMQISEVCKNESLGREETYGYYISLTTPAFAISSEDNKFVTVGCDTYGYLNTFRNGTQSSTGCLTRCDSLQSVESMQRYGNCTGIGCCQVDIPPRMKNISFEASSFHNFNSTSDFNKCGYSFVVKNGNYLFSVDHLRRVPFNMTPLVMDWSVGNDTCEASKGRPGYACKSPDSECEKSPSEYGYRCKCKKGFQGNAYLPHGCQDILECSSNKHNCDSEDHCRETPGSFECFCPDGLIGNGKKESGGCHRRQPADAFKKIVIGAGVGLIALFLGISWLYLMYQKRKDIKLKQKFFQQNGGIILRQQLSTEEDSSQTTTIFSAEQLKKATNNFDESLIIGKGGYGTVFKGFLSNNKVVAIKKSKIVDQNQVEQFINEVIILSQINHRNVVKLLGCCLETEVPLLVYEFVNNGTLYDYLHNQGQGVNVSWKTRLRIATEAAAALSYLHSEACIPIIHRDVKTANILLDDTYTAKVSDFGASRLVPIDHTEITTIVQGTLGYLDPEYMQSSQLTEKSDVYSFGVVLVELLTGEKAFSFSRAEEQRSLTVHFLCSLKEDRLFDVIQVGLLDEENQQEIMQVAILAARCLRLTGEERPSMKEVTMELEGIKLTKKDPGINTDKICNESQYLLRETQSSCEHGDTSSQQNTEYDSLREHEVIDFGDGR
ncbi:putative wall-associated receptor kinase-like 16 isoform X2 [Vigna radiata var. radiata]|nr:putative wall-associated receptor kinase-like 16 isoform X2 [Vigna radiata var. radiata]XP_014505178.1 putative wall-associated receptor kinase-like 16 isoform X2 [Vigna radiata var. radiata]XP_014505179.1 putative wall-associated receptor kinase-like 16 isoform X2 [Vigna radiata var. radiata]XP_022638064.1 putative wall-associated receptor kinase-like 16 isoform X2 [Vigna radiata var. radiata]XP_022638065.1 putative wall-associated receptor kinase-like 16 isoform X2 [Vigna radiata var. radi